MRHVVLEAAQHGVHIDCAAGRRFHPQHAVAFHRRQLDQAVGAFVDGAEALFAVHGEQGAVAAVGPCVEGAAETLALAAAVRHHLGAAMAAAVGERPEHALVIPRHQDGEARLAVCPEAAGLRQVSGQPHEEWRIAEEHLPLGGQQFTASEVRQRALHDAIAMHLAAAVVKAVLQDAQQALLLFNAHGADAPPGSGGAKRSTCGRPAQRRVVIS